MGKPHNKPAMPSHSKPRPEKRKSNQFDKDTSKLSPASKKLKSDNPMEKATSLSNRNPSPLHPTPSGVKDHAASIPAPRETWKRGFHIEEIRVTSGTKIQKKVTQVLDAIVDRAEGQQVVMALRAEGAAAGKMISVAEIAKREMGKKGIEWFQYTKVGQIMTEVEKKQRKKKIEDGSDKEGGEKEEAAEEEKNDEEDEEDAFETMKTPFERAIEGKKKVRAVAHMTIYLTHVRIGELKKVYG